MDVYLLSTTIFCSTSIVGFHRWPDAPADVNYLRNLHRHLFGIQVEVSVIEHDREVEFHMLKRQVESWLWLMKDPAPRTGDFTEGTGEIIFGARSCEMIASALLNELRNAYPGRAFYLVTVDEDGENGANASAILQAPHND